MECRAISRPRKKEHWPMMNVEHKRYWQKHISLFAGTFSCFCRTGELRSVQVHGKIHQSNERYADIETERVPIQPSTGERISFHMDLYVEEPHLSRTLVTLPHNQIVTSAMAAVQASRAEGLRHIPIGKCLGWYYSLPDTFKPCIIAKNTIITLRYK